MIRFSAVVALAALAACQPAKTPEQVAAENAAKAAQELAAAFGADVNSEQLAAALGQAGAIAATDPNITPEQRANLQIAANALASGKVHPAASGWLAGANKTLALIGTVKDTDDANAIRPQLAAIYAEMTGPATALRAMNEEERNAAFGSALPQLMQISVQTMSVFAPLANKPELADTVSEMLEGMPQVE